MKKWVAIVFSLYLLMASSLVFAVAKQDVSAREGVKATQQLISLEKRITKASPGVQAAYKSAKEWLGEGVKTGTKGVGVAARGVNQAFKPLMNISQSQAEAVAKTLGGKFMGAANNNKGYIIHIGHLNRPTVIRLMNEGSGQRGQAYFRIAKEGKPAYTRSGEMLRDPTSTHHNLYAGDIVQQIQEVLEKIPKK